MPIGVKICGITRLEDALLAFRTGASAIGLNFCESSSRYLDGEAAAQLSASLPPFKFRVGVFVDSDIVDILETVRLVSLDTVQLHGKESPEIAESLREEGLGVWKAFQVADADSLDATRDYPCDAILLDSFDPNRAGGTGQPFDWRVLSNWEPDRPWILSGGLNPDNVAEAIRRLKPDWVDVASGVESAPGIKEPLLLETFIASAKEELGS